MALFKMAALGVAAYAAWKFYENNQTRDDSVAFATGESTDGFAPVRNAGPDAMRSDPPEWDKVDEEVDESFPASDPPPMGKR